MKKKTIMSLLLCTAMVTALATGCGTKEAEKTGATEEAEEKVITIGCEATTPGWAQTDEDGNISGYDYDVWQEIGKRIGYEIDYRVMEWDGMWVMLDDDRLDTVGEQISYTDERAEKYNLSEPYAYNIYSLLSAEDNEELQTMDDLKSGMTICCESNTSDELIKEAVEAEYNIELEPVYYDGMSVQDVVLGRCDLWPRAYTSCVTTINEVDNLKILGNTNVVESNVYPFAKNERGEMLCKLVSEALKEMKADGTLEELSQKWFNTDVTVKPEGAEDLK